MKKRAKKIDLLERGFEPRIFEYNSHPQFELSQKARVTGSNQGNLLKEGLYLVVGHLSNLKWISSQTLFEVALIGIFLKELWL